VVSWAGRGARGGKVRALGTHFRIARRVGEANVSGKTRRLCGRGGKVNGQVKIRNLNAARLDMDSRHERGTSHRKIVANELSKNEALVRVCNPAERPKKREESWGIRTHRGWVGTTTGAGNWSEEGGRPGRGVKGDR